MLYREELVGHKNTVPRQWIQVLKDRSNGAQVSVVYKNRQENSWFWHYAPDRKMIEEILSRPLTYVYSLRIQWFSNDDLDDQFVVDYVNAD